jgi:hypothetical protein
MISRLRRWAADRRFAVNRWLLDRRDPEQDFAKIDDLRAEAARRGWPVEDRVAGRIQSTIPARCLSEDFVKWVTEGQDLLRRHREWHRDPRISWRWANALHAVRRYPVSDTFVCTVPQAKIYQRGGAVLTAQDELIRESYFGLWKPRRSEWTTATPRRLDGRLLHFAVIYADSNISHFTLDCALKATLFASFAGERILATPTFREWHYETFELLGITRDQFVFTDTLVTQCDELVIAKTSDECFFPHEVLLAEFRRRVLAGAGVTDPPRPTRRLYISRARDKRPLVNEDALWPLWKERGFERIFCQDLATRDKVRLFAEAEVVAGPHGSGFINCLFARPGAKLIELHNPFWWDASTPHYAQLLGHEYWYGFGENASAAFDTSFPRQKLERLLDYALGGPSTDPVPY